MNTENALSEEIRQFNEQMAFDREQFNWQVAQASARSSGGGGGGGGGGYSRSGGGGSSSSGSSKLSGSSGSSGGASVNLNSVLKSGLGPASGATIANAVQSGTHTATQKGNQVYISKNTSSSSSKNPTFGLLYSKTKF